MSGETEVSPGPWDADSGVPSLVESPGALTFSDTDVGHPDGPDVNVAYRWSKMYANDVEYEPFFTWIDRRSNPERTDFQQILESVPLKWGPESLPPPLRRFFLSRFSK